MQTRSAVVGTSRAMRAGAVGIAALLALAPAAMSQPIYVDDPLAEIAVADWFRTLPAAPPAPPAPAARPPADDIAATIIGQLAAEAARDVGPPAAGAGIVGGTPSVLSALACTLPATRAATEPFQAVVLGQLDAVDARAAARGAVVGAPALARMLVLDPFMRLPNAPPIPEPISLRTAAELDQLTGGQYWTIRWHERQAFQYAMTLANWANVPIRVEAGIAGGDLTMIPGGFGPAQIPGAFQNYLAMRTEMLAAATDWIAALRAMGCEPLADAIHFRIAVMFSYGDEYDRLFGEGEEYWRAFGFAAGRAQFSRSVVGFGYGYVTDYDNWYVRMVEEALAGTVTEVEAFLGPLPPAPTPAGIPAANAAVTAPSGDAVALTTPANALPTVPPEALAGNEPAATPANWDAPPTPRGRTSGSQPAAGATLNNVTWINAAGVGAWAQPDLTGFWRFVGQDDRALTHLRADESGTRFEGWVVADAEIADRWVEMGREGDTTGWRGQIQVVLDEPAGGCSRWTQGVFIIRPSAPILDGAWAGPRVDPSNCADTNEQDGGAIQLERLVATVFQPIVPGKYIHLIAAPAVGPNPAQYSAAVSFACTTMGLPVAQVRVVSAEGRLVEIGPCRYQLVFDRPGDYDIAVELVGRENEVLHVDRLHADIPAIPGLLQ